MDDVDQQIRRDCRQAKSRWFAETGGAAFPTQPLQAVTRTWDADGNLISSSEKFNSDEFDGFGMDGMTLLDWFAGRALTARAAAWGETGQSPDEIAIDCYRLAAAMISERNRIGGQ